MRSAQLGEVNYLPSADGILDDYPFGMRMEDSASAYCGDAASEPPIQPTSTGEFNGSARASTPSLSPPLLSPEPLNPSDFPKSKEMLQRVGKTLFNK